jgi:hypothetical protein
VAVAALVISGLGNGIRVPPIAAETTRRIPPAHRAEALTASSAIVLGGGVLALLLAGLALGQFGPATVLAGVALIQTIAAALVLALAAFPAGGPRTFGQLPA